MDVRRIAGQALKILQQQGFDHVQVQARVSTQDEVNIAHDHAALLRSTESQRLEMTGLLDGRKASTELSDLDEQAIRHAADELYANAKVAPQDEANAVSSAQAIRIQKGPRFADLDLLTDKVRELLDFRASETPLMHMEEGYCAHSNTTTQVFTSGGSDLSAQIGCHTLGASGSAREGVVTSSFNYAGGSSEDISTRHASEWFGIGDMLRDSQKQIHCQSIEKAFIGDVVLAPNAVADILTWLQGQVGDMQLISNSSLYRESLGQQIASPLLSIRSRFDGPGVSSITADAFVAKPLTLLDKGCLKTLLPSLYGSRKTGLAHIPSLPSGWEIDAGMLSRAELIEGVKHGALVGRLSMGSPAPNGEFSSVIKNSFLIKDGLLGPALSEVMISGNLARLLGDVVAVSKERIDSGSSVFPWIHLVNLHFS